MTFSNILIQWYLREKRDLPWRKTKNPYLVWLSEIMLQQTRVAQGMSYYHAFSETFPTVFDLANASETKVLKMWQGLGYYSRARNLHYTAKYIANELNGEFPNNYTELLDLKGVGEYTAAAIASICFNEPVAVVDGNVYRVLSRYYGIQTPINSTNGKKEFKTLAQELLTVKQPDVYNQAIMDFGAIQCKPKSPDCTTCPLNNSCVALEKQTVKDLPVKEKKGKVRKRYFNYIVVITSDNKTILQERTQKGIWKGLFEFPLIETETNLEESELFDLNAFQDLVPDQATISLFNADPVVHKLSHQHLYTRFWIVKSKSHSKATIPCNSVKKYPVPILIANFINQYGMS